MSHKILTVSIEDVELECDRQAEIGYDLVSLCLRSAYVGCSGGGPRYLLVFKSREEA